MIPRVLSELIIQSPTYFSGLQTEGDVFRFNLREGWEKLPLWIPGLKIVRSSSPYGWFSWTASDMRDRYAQLLSDYGACDPRLAYRVCSGSNEDKQLDLPGFPSRVEPVYQFGAIFSSSWTQYGLKVWDSAFCHRILNPDEGGPEAIPFSHRVVHSGEWWLMGSKGDGKDVLQIEILSSPLSQRTKDNLLLNLRRQ